MNLTWQDNSTNEAEFIIYRKVGRSGTYNELVRVPSDTTSYTDTTPDNQVYCYEVRASNDAGISFQSNADCGPKVDGDPTKLKITIVQITVP